MQCCSEKRHTSEALNDTGISRMSFVITHEEALNCVFFFTERGGNRKSEGIWECRCHFRLAEFSREWTLLSEFTEQIKYSAKSL